MTTKEITGCVDCPCCDDNDFCEGYTCTLSEGLTVLLIELDNQNFIPTDPEWCPLKKGPIVFKLVP